MPIQVKTPDGNIAQFPDGMSDTAIAAILAKEFPAPKAAPEAAKPSGYADVLKGAATGAVKGVTGLVGGIGDAANLINSGIDAAQNYVTGSDVKTPQVPFNSGALNKVAFSPFGGEYQPETTAGKYAETIASFLPAAASPGGLAARMARVAIPGAASETAGELTQGTSLEPYARTIGALAGGAAAGVGELALTARTPTPGVPTVTQLKTAAHGQYTAADDAGLIVKGASMKLMAGRLAKTLSDEGVDATLHPKATAVYKNIANTSDNTTLKGIDILRQQAGDAAGSADRAERRLGRIIKDHLDDYVANLTPSDVVQGDAPGAAASITSARDLWSRASKGEIIDNAIQKAGANSGTYTVAGDENALRVQFRKLANNDRAMRRFSPQEQDAIRQVATGTTVGNALRYLGKLAPRGVISGLPTFEAFQQGGPAAAAAVATAGEIGKIGSAAVTVKNARLASELVRKGPGRSISQISNGAPTYAETLAALSINPSKQRTPQQ